MSFLSTALIIAIVLIIAFLIFMIVKTDNSNELDNFKRKADTIDIDLTKVKVESKHKFIKKANKDSSLITLYYYYKGKKLKHEELVDRGEKYVKETLYIRRETTLFIDPKNPTNVYLDLDFLFRHIHTY